MNIRFKVLIIMFFVLFVGSLYAETINVFSNYKRAEIFVNDEFVGTGQARNVLVDPGTHFVRVQLDGVDIYSKVVDVDYGRTETIVVDKFVDTRTNIANKGAKTLEARRIKESRGGFGFGVNVGVLSGVSLKWYLTNRIGFQGTTFVAFSDDFGYSSWETRFIYILKDTVLANNLATLYFSSGYGNKNKNIHVSDVNLGVDLSLAQWIKRPNYGQSNLGNDIFMGLLSLENAFVFFEVGYTEINDDRKGSTKEYKGIGGRTGLHFFF